MKQIKATFKGENGSCGYTNGEEYTLNITDNPVIEINCTVQVVEGHGRCFYSSIHSFLNNWDNIRQV